jgi:hypothetical protein
MYKKGSFTIHLLNINKLIHEINKKNQHCNCSIKINNYLCDIIERKQL